MRTGVFDMPMEDYQAAHGISQSRLKLLARTPAHLQYATQHPKPSTPDQIFGTVAGIAIFEPEKLESCCHVKPANYQNAKGEWKKWNGNAKECKDWLGAREDRPILSQEAFTNVLGVRDAVFAHPGAALALREGKAEQSFFSEDPETGLQLKARLDWTSGNTIVDLKTTGDASNAGFAKTIANFSYHLQAAFYLDIAALLGFQMDHFVFIVAEKEPPYCVAVWELDPVDVEIGRGAYRRLLSRYLECVTKDQFPAYSPNIERISLPAYARKADFNAMLLEDSAPMPALEVS